LAELIVDYYDQLKTRTAGYASMDYEEIGYRPANLLRLDRLVAGEPAGAASRVACSARWVCAGGSRSMRCRSSSTATTRRRWGERSSTGFASSFRGSCSRGPSRPASAPMCLPGGGADD